jgi:hypothetical protein
MNRRRMAFALPLRYKNHIMVMDHLPAPAGGCKCRAAPDEGTPSKIGFHDVPHIKYVSDGGTLTGIEFEEVALRGPVHATFKIHRDIGTSCWQLRAEIYVGTLA